MYFIGDIRQEYCSIRPSRWGWLKGSVVLWALATGTAMAAQASGGIESHSEPVSSEMAAPAKLPDYSGRSDYELTELGVRWDELTRPERDALLREVKLRMAQRRDSDGVLVIRTQRRYGRIYQGDGRYMKIETKVVRVRPAEQDAADSSGFGTGFEQRSAENGLETVAGEPAPTESDSQPGPAVQDAPVIRVSDPTQ